MINTHSLHPLQRSHFSPYLYKPDYNHYSFTQIAPTIQSLFTPTKTKLPETCWVKGSYERVIFILIDGFGWNVLQAYQEQFPFLQQMIRQGIVSKISAQFPSTTAAHITTFCTGLETGSHGIYEWFLYEPSANQIVLPIPYQFARKKENESLHESLDPKQFFPKSTLFTELKKQGIKSRVYLQDTIKDSIFSQVMYEGAQICGYGRCDDLPSQLQKDLQDPGFFFLYFGGFDSLAHRHGIYSIEAKKALEAFFLTLDRLMQVSSAFSHPSTALLLSADHGMTPINPSTTFYLNEKIPELNLYVKKGQDQKLLTPSGSSRDFFLHIEEGKQEKVENLLKEHLQGMAEVISTHTLVKEGFFGSHPLSVQMEDRLADLVIFPFKGHSVWWHEKDTFEQNFYAMHGGLTLEELEIPLIFYSKRQKTS